MENWDRLQRWLLFNLRYLRRPPWDTGISPPELLAYLRDHPAGRALDLGCGTGLNVLTLAQTGWQVTGVDFALRAIQRARQRLQRAGLRADLRVGDVTRLPDFSARFDLVLDIGCLHGLSAAGKQAYLAQLPRLLAPDGALLLYAHLAQPEARVGISEEEIAQMAALLTLEQRQNSPDRWGRGVAWFTFRAAAA